MTETYQLDRFHALTEEELRSCDGGIIGTIIIAVGRVIIQVGGRKVMEFVGVTAVASAIGWCVNKGMDYIFK